MKLKSACLAWFGLFLFMAVLIGALVYRRMGVVEPALVAGFIGGGLAWVGFGFVAGIREKLADILRIRHAVAGQRPADVRRASAVREGQQTTIRIDENLVVLKLDQQKLLISLQISGQTIDLSSSAEDIEWETMSGESDDDFAGRLTYFSDRNPGLASYISFRAPVLTVAPL